MIPTLVIRPHPTGEGYTVGGDGMTVARWFLDEMTAIRDAEHRLQWKEGRIVVLRSDGSTEIHWHYCGNGRVDSLGPRIRWAGDQAT